MLYSNKDLKKLIVPLIIEQTLAIAVGMADTIMVSAAGEAAVSGVSLVDTVNILLINVFSALATGGAVVAGHYLGQKHKEEASKVAWQILMFAASLALAISVIFIAFHDTLLRLMFGQIETTVMEAAKTYLIITALSFTGLAVYNSCAAVFRAMNNARVTMWVSLLINAVNLVGNAVCIYGLKWGVAGAAVPTTVSRYVGAIVILVMMFNPARDINFCGQVRFRFNPVLIKRILYIAVPNGLENSMFQLGKILVLSVVSTMGTSAIAANAVGNTLASWNILFGSAINLGLVSVSAVCIGAGEIEQTRYYTRKMMKIAISLTAVMSAILFFTVPFLVRLYNLGPEASQMAIQVMRFHNIMAVLFWVPSFTVPNTLRSAGDVIWTMAIAIFSMWIFRIGASYLFTYVFHLGLLGVWAAMVVDWVFRAACYAVRYRGHRWETAMYRRNA
ncbi:MAG TPA: MATE family efflux transporter [Candidatus Eisenbergiella merdavium]|uniref:Probable multidrug resistance protein NorM n=1 Tax=Candidatus Eisenbergiella merdavium TaxID=2838551 RepID=A0A9D2SS81_9FIRM|nr:MATE family efflux transporter [Candidatus Eisenbergiella merdavium]